MGEQQLITLIVAMFASTGFWAFVRTIYEHWCEKKKEEKHKVSYELVNDLRKALLGVMHTMIFSLGTDYVQQGTLTLEEYDNFMTLYKPYEKLGGNGTGKKLKNEIEKIQVTDAQTNT